jgi:hypothetical protein
MERKFEFRGQDKNNNWVYGDLIHYDNNDYRILPQNERNWDILESGFEVIPETLGQYGNIQTDKGRKIYEGDICFEEVEGDTGDKRIYYVFIFITEWNMFAWLSIDEYKSYKDYGVGYLYQTAWYSGTEPLQYAGNIYDNPVLLNK